MLIRSVRVGLLKEFLLWFYLIHSRTLSETGWSMFLKILSNIILKRWISLSARGSSVVTAGHQPKFFGFFSSLFLGPSVLEAIPKSINVTIAWTFPWIVLVRTQIFWVATSLWEILKAWIPLRTWATWAMTLKSWGSGVLRYCRYLARDIPACSVISIHYSGHTPTNFWTPWHL